MTISCQNNVLLSTLSISSRFLRAQIFLFFNLSIILQIFVKGLLVWKKRRIFWACCKVGRELPFHYQELKTFQFLISDFSFFKCFFQQGLTPVTFICPEVFFFKKGVKSGICPEVTDININIFLKFWKSFQHWWSLGHL